MDEEASKPRKPARSSFSAGGATADSDAWPPSVTSFHGVAIAMTSLEHAAAHIVENQSAATYRLVNAYSLALAGQDASYHALLAGPGVNLPDGRPLAAIINRTSPSELSCGQVRGPSLFEEVLDRGREKGLRHFFLGSSDETLSRLRTEVTLRYPGLRVAGVHAPPFRPLDSADHTYHDQLIRDSGADIVWVGMGTPRQDFEASRIFESVGVSTVGIGAAFDFSAGLKREAPIVLRRLGLEWLFRLATEPRRLFRRYVVGNCRFLLMVARHWRST